MFLTLVATLGGLLFGYDTAVISGTVKYLDLNFVAPLGLSETAASSLLGFAVSSALIGCVLGGMVGGVVASALGRKRGLMIAAVLFIISAVGSAYPEMGFPHGAPHTFLTQFIIYRIMGGPRIDAFADVHRRNGPRFTARRIGGVEPVCDYLRNVGGLFRQLFYRAER